MRKICAMRNDQELHQLFRARLPIATLPKEFADRLTKAVLDEVAHLRQTHPLTQGCPDSYLEDSTPLPPLTKPPKSSPLPCATKTVAFLLLLHFLLWPFLQGCALPTTAIAAQSSSTRLDWTDSQRSAIRPNQTNNKQPSNRTAATILGAQTRGRALQPPPLRPLKPQLPIVQFQQRVFVSKAKLTYLATPNPAEALINLHGPPGTEQEIPTTITLTVPYAVQNTDQDIPLVTPQEPTPVLIEQQPAATAVATATPTTELLLIKPTVPPATPILLVTPILSIFEPTTTPISTAEAPTGAATEAPTAIPTICLQPWQTSAAEPPSVPTISPAPTASEP